MKELIKKTAKEFHLNYSKGTFNHLILTKRQIVLTNFLGKCPFEPYNKFKNLEEFSKSNEFKIEIKNSQGRKITKNELKRELELIKKIKDKKLRKDLFEIYSKIKINLKKEHLALSSERNKKIILHELLHELIDTNNLRPKSIDTNEGLIHYLTEYTLNPKNSLKNLEEITKKVKGNKKWENTYFLAVKWAKLLKDYKIPLERKKIIKKHKDILK